MDSVTRPLAWYLQMGGKQAGSILRSLQTRGLSGTVKWAGARLRKAPYEGFHVARSSLAGGRGLEIGGPSRLFEAGGRLPVYPLAASVDNCNFGATTIWEGSLRDGESFQPVGSPKLGQQLIREAFDLFGIEDDEYDFVISCHMLEHSANPLRALHEWVRVMRPGGSLVLVLPNKVGTFDRRRPTTSLAHLVEDYRCQRDEADPTHFDEVLELHEFGLDDGASPGDAFEDRVRTNAIHRSIHHHTFELETAVALVRECGLTVVHAEAPNDGDLVVIGRLS
jgi:SAM-dependent methyltransferase